LRILSGLLPSTRGDALVFGVDAAGARRAVTYVPQQATLFSVSLMDNLRIFSGGAPPERILAAAKATGLLDAISGWPMGLETVVSFGATNISSGQRQLVLFTAAVASEAPIVLLDEALAHVDLKIRARLGAASLFRGRTVISVVHDASAHELRTAREVRALAATG
jgi:ABC-type bacteriocin/lantibiotic exporter with double-glycine peptidase domain